jgi:hypothetical protein
MTDLTRLAQDCLMLPKQRSRRTATPRKPTKLNGNPNMTGTCPHRRTLIEVERNAAELRRVIAHLVRAR